MSFFKKLHEELGAMTSKDAQFSHVTGTLAALMEQVAGIAADVAMIQANPITALTAAPDILNRAVTIEQGAVAEHNHLEANKAEGLPLESAVNMFESVQS